MEGRERAEASFEICGGRCQLRAFGAYDGDGMYSGRILVRRFGNGITKL